MKNRLQSLGQFTLSLMLLFSFSQNGLAQCPDITGTNFTTILGNPYANPFNTVVLDANCEQTLMIPDIEVTSNAGFTAMLVTTPFSITDTGVTGNGYSLGSTVTEVEVVEITYEVIVTPDGGGASTTETICIAISFVDQTPPVFNMVQVPADITVSCPNDIPDAPSLIAMDECDNSNITSLTTDTPGQIVDCINSTMIVTRTWTAEDLSNNVATVMQTITVLANEPPIFTGVLMDETVDCNNANFAQWFSQMNGIATNPANYSDGCGAVTVTNNFNASQPDTLCGAKTITWSFRDNCMATTTVSATYTKVDDTVPTFDSFPLDVTISCADTPPVVPIITATDNCDASPVVTMVMDSIPGDCAFRYTIRRTWTAKDICDNMMMNTWEVVYTDNVPPAFKMDSIPPQATVEVSCDADQSVGALGNIMPDDVEDDCDANLTVTFVEKDTMDLPECVSDFEYKRVWTITDDCGNFFEYTQRIMVMDEEAPVVTFSPADITIQCSESTDPSNTGQITATDNCTMPPIITCIDEIAPSGNPIMRICVVTDSCDHFVRDTQMITIIDPVDPVIAGGADMALTCDLNVDLTGAFKTFIDNNANATATDNCTAEADIIWMAFYSGTTTVADSISFVDTLNSVTCPTPTMGILSSVDVDFIAFDGVGNADTVTYSFTVTDDTAPVLTNCPMDITVENDTTVCDATLMLVMPMIVEGCDNEAINQMSSVSAPIVSDHPDSLTIPVNPVQLTFAVDGPPFSANAAVSLSILIENGDIEQPTEFFRILGEDGTLLGQTLNTVGQMQCTDTTTIVTITAAQFNDWAFDGALNITLEPNIPMTGTGTDAINDICGGSSATGNLTYQGIQPNSVSFAYTINNIDTITAPIAAFPVTFAQGTNSVEYFFTDCSGNTATCAFNVTVEDTEAPVIVCPSDLTLDVDSSLCQTTLEIPLFTDVFDNCAVTTPITVAANNNSDSLLIFALNPNLGVQNAEDILINFPTPIQGNATPGSVQLIIEMQGDFNNPANEFFQIFDQNDSLMGTTASVIADCNTAGTLVFNINAQTFNNWANNGPMFFTAISNLNIPPPGTPDSGINPCDDLDATGRDSISYLTAYLQYESVSPDFSISGATTVATTTLMPPLVPQMHTLNPGINTVTYSVNDLAGNPAECTFDITIEDNDAPVAQCVAPLFININPSGFVQDTIFPSEINDGSFDNCGIASMTVDIAGPLTNVVTCTEMGMVLNVTLLVTDDFGNDDSCTTQIAVQSTKPVPTVVSNCGSDTLSLFANPPVTPGGNNAYQCQWTGPDGFVSFDCNPIILDADADNSGFYTVTITGITGCTASGTVQVTVSNLPLAQPTIQANNTSVCENTLVNFTTTPVTGNVVTYQWYFGSPPNAFLLATTTTNTYNWLGSSEGIYNFYVESTRGFCTSAPSEVISITVKDNPVAQIAPDNAVICEGSTLTFPIVNSTASSTCVWTGPAGFTSNSCSPAPIVDVMQANSGFYNLVLTEDGCQSAPATYTVSVLERPNTPTLFSNTFPNNPICEGEILLLNASNISGAVSYEWESPALTIFTSSSNTLNIPTATLAQHGGNWRIRAIGNPCVSEWSQPHFVNISVRPESVTASVADNPACEGETVTFSASSATANVSYEWIYPNGTTLVAGSTFDIEDVTLSNQGTYTVVVTNEFGCSTTESVNLLVNDRPNITGVANNAPNCVLGPVNIQLTATVFPPNDGTYTYLWTGDGFSSTDSIATIPQATASDSGPYSLIVTNGEGCSSVAATTTVIISSVVPTPAAPQTDAPSPFCAGETVVFTTTVGAGNNVTYIWETPQGTITTANSSLTIDPIETANSGSYTVRTEADGCQSATSGATIIQVKPKPVANPTSNSPVCEGESLQLSVNCMTGTQYEWQGPDGFSSSLCNPVIPNATASLMGEPFRVRVLIDGCWSDEALISVNVKAKPAQPVAVNFGPYCSSSQDVTVGVSAASATAGATYTWFVAGTDVSLGQATGLTFTIPNAEQYGNGTTSFVAVANLDGCESNTSVSTDVVLNTIPTNAAEAGPSITVCDGDIITLQATAPTVGTGLWTLTSGSPNGISIANPDQSTTTAAGFTPGVPYVFQWTLSNGVCENYSFDTTGVFVNIVEFAEAGASISVCNETSVQLNATAPISNIGMWSQPNGQAVLGVNITDPIDPTTTLTGLIPGQSFLFTWTIEGGCGEDEETISVTVSNETAFAGSDLESCSIDGCIELSADAASGGGVWSTTDPNLQIISPNDPNTTVCGFTPGESVLTWFINDGACGEASSDAVTIEFQTGPIANDDQIGIAFAQETNLQLLLNDQVPDNFTIRLLDEPVGGTIELDETTGIITYDANIRFIGAETITYELCAENCECSTAIITIQVGVDAQCVAPNIFTPNQDNINDFFVIPCLADGTKFPNSEISIFNTWGDEVFGSAPYQNNWDGSFDGEDLPSGTYFYVLDLGNGEKPMSGFITLQR